MHVVPEALVNIFVKIVQKNAIVVSRGVRRILKLRSGSGIQKRQCRVASVITIITFSLLSNARFGLHFFISGK